MLYSHKISKCDDDIKFWEEKISFWKGKKSEIWLYQDLNRGRLGERPMTNPHNHGSVVKFFQKYFIAHQSFLKLFSRQIQISKFTKMKMLRKKWRVELLTWKFRISLKNVSRFSFFLATLIAKDAEPPNVHCTVHFSLQTSFLDNLNS